MVRYCFLVIDLLIQTLRPTFFPSPGMCVNNMSCLHSGYIFIPEVFVSTILYCGIHRSCDPQFDMWQQHYNTCPFADKVAFSGDFRVWRILSSCKDFCISMGRRDLLLLLLCGCTVASSAAGCGHCYIARVPWTHELHDHVIQPSNRWPSD